MRLLPALLGLVVSGCGRLDFAPLPDASVNGEDADVRARAGSRLDLNRHAPVEALTNFPLLVVLDDTRADRARFGENAATLRFRDADGVVIPHEVDENLDDATLVWVRVPRYVGASTFITVEYGGEPAPRATEPVWGDDFEGVWHLSDAGGVGDSSTRNRDGMAVLGARSVAAQIGRGLAFDSIEEEYVTIPDGSWPATPEFTMSAWVTVDMTSTSSVMYSAFVARQRAGEDDDFWLGVDNTGFYTAAVTTEAATSTTTATEATFGEMHFVAATWLPTGVTVYVDGAIVDSGPSIGTTLLAGENPILIGGSRNTAGGDTSVADDDFLDGTIDEVRLSRVARSAVWMAAENATARDAVISYGPVEAR